jgi:transcriptional regulator
MYIPEHFRARHNSDAVAFMRAHPFTILVSSTPEGPFATHLPLSIHETPDQVLLRGHVAMANRHWRYLQENPDCLTIFHGPHAYISPSNYATAESVPTWNYAAVHAYGKARILDNLHELEPMLEELISSFDDAYLPQWEALGKDYRARMLSHIVGFEIAVTSIEAKFKLSQNRTRDERSHIIQSLGSAPDSNISDIAELMRKAEHK